MADKIKFSFLLLLFAFIFSFSIDEISFSNDTAIVATTIYETTDESHFSYSNYDDTNRTVSIAYDKNTPFTSNIVVLPSTTTKDGITYNVTSITSGGFYACLLIEEVVISENIELINSNAFRGCTNLQKITFNTSVLKEIGDSAFASCTSLSSLFLPEGVQTISSFAFDGCSSLEILYLPTTLNNIALGSFTGCSNLKAIYINSLISFANVDVFDATTCPIIVLKENIEHYQDSSKFNKSQNVTYVVDIEINYNGGTDSNGETSGIVHKLFGFTFDYFVDEKTGVWNKSEESIYSNLPSGLKLFKENQEFRLASYSYNGEEIFSELKVDQALFETGIDATYEGLFKTTFENGVHTIEGISNSFITGEFLEITIPTIYWDGENNGIVKGISDNAFKDLKFLSFTFQEGIDSIGANAFENVDIRNAIVIPQSVSFIGDNAFDNATCTPGYIYLNEDSSYGIDVFNNVSVVIVTPNEEIYDVVKSTINNSNLTYLINITFDYNEGTYDNESSLTLTRLPGKELSYVQQLDLSWDFDHNFNLPKPTKQDYLHTSFECNGNDVNRASTFTSDATVNSTYILQYVRTNSTSNITASMYFPEGISTNSTLSITSSSDYTLSGSTTNLDIYGMYSIELLVDGVSYESSSYNINILLPEGMGVVETYAIYMMQDGKLVEVIGEYNDGYITFNLSSLNDIALANEELILSVAFNEGILMAILVLAVINIIEFCLIFNLNRG
ncbi:MAG: leucine-rich repeat protein, partial [bacterium]